MKNGFWSERIFEKICSMSVFDKIKYRVFKVENVGRRGWDEAKAFRQDILFWLC